MNPRDSAIGAIVHTCTAGRFDGTFFYGAMADGDYSIECERKGRWGRSVLTQFELAACRGDADSLVSRVIDGCRWAWQAAGGGALVVPFRIGRWCPKHLQIARPS